MGDAQEAPRDVIPAVGVNLIGDLGAGRQLTLQTHFAQDSDDKAAHALLDRMNRLMDRSQAPFLVEKLEEELRTHERALFQMDEDLAKVEGDFNRKCAMRNEDIAKYAEARDKIVDDGAAHYKATGRHGEFALRGADKSRVAVAEGQIAALKADMDKDVAERDVAVQVLSVSKNRFQDEIARLHTQLKAKRALLEG